MAPPGRNLARNLGLTALCTLALFAVSATGERAPQAPADDCIPGTTCGSMPSGAREYAAMCALELGVAPTVDCGAGVLLPITVGGVEVFEDPGLHECDKASLQIGDCMPGSSLQRFEGRNADGTPRPDVVWVSFCRHDGRDDVVGFDMPDSVQLIGYNYDTGATCFFESGDNRPWTHVDESNRLLGVLPGPDDPAFDQAYTVPGVQCVRCHQADPFNHNPWINSARLPEDPRQPVLPVIPGPNSPYYVVGGQDWDMRTIHIEGNRCLGCHRIGMETLAEYTGDHWDPNEHMPPHAPGAFAADYAELVACWENGPENTPGCDWVIPPAGDCDGGVVGADYPHAAARFNRGTGDDGRRSDGEWRRPGC